MKLRQLVSVGWLARRVVGELRGIREALQRQNELLERLAVRFAPTLPTADRDEIGRDTGISHLNADELALALDYSARVERDTGLQPTDDQVLSYLADERTTDLHERLSEREAEMQRLTQERRAR